MFSIKHTPALVGLTILLLCWSGITVAKEGNKKVTAEQLATETATRMAADQVLRNNIENISLMPGPAGPAGPPGPPGPPGDDGAALQAEEAARIAGDLNLQNQIGDISTELQNLEELVSSLASTMLYSRSGEVELVPNSGPESVGASYAFCDVGDEVVGGTCIYYSTLGYQVFPERGNRTTFIREGALVASGFEDTQAWICWPDNSNGIFDIEVKAIAICKPGSE